MISVLLYVHNGARYLGDLLESVFAQTYQDFELCVVDDGSTDATPEILAALDDPRVLVERSEGYGRDNLHLTFNRCISMASRDLLAVANADDVWRADKLERQLAQFVADPELDVCAHDCRFIDDIGRVQLGGFRPTYSLNVVDGIRGRDFVVGDLVPNPSAMFRREILRVVGVQETGWMHDYQFWMKAALSGCRFRNLPDRLVSYRVHEDSHSTSSARRDRIRTEELAMLGWMVERYRIDELYPELALCDDGERSAAWAHVHLSRMLRARELEDLADAHLATARRLAPRHVGADDADPRWFGAPPAIATVLGGAVPGVRRASVPAADAVVPVADDADPAGVDAALASVLPGGRAAAPVLVLTDGDAGTELALRRYAAVGGADDDPSVDLLQVHPGEMPSVVQAHLYEGARLVPVGGGPRARAVAGVPYAPASPSRRQVVGHPA